MPVTRDEGCRSVVLTPMSPGAVAIVQLHGDVEPVLAALTGCDTWPLGCLRHASLVDVDEAVVVRLSATVAQLMPHGGPRVIQRLQDELRTLGVLASNVGEIDAADLYPEADDTIEARALAAIARAPSPLAIDLLLAQPGRWQSGTVPTAADHERSRRLNRLLDPPSVVVAGRANVGKSTLSNALAGRSMSIALDRPGTTRDYTTTRIDLAGLVVRWHDTPGLRQTDDVIERRAQTLALRIIGDADLLIAMTDLEQDWPTLPREPDLRIATKSDLSRRDDADLSISATTGAGVEELVARVRDTLVPPEDLSHPGVWVFW